MDFCRNVSVSGEYQPEQVLYSPRSKLGASIAAAANGSADDLFPAQNTEVDVSMEWLSIFVEDCLSSTGNCIPVAAATNVQTKSTTTAKEPSKSLQQTPPSLEKFVIPGKARSKRKRAAAATTTNPFSIWSHHLTAHNQNLQFASSDPPLLQQAYWLAESELIVPKKEDDNSSNNSSSNLMGNSEVGGESKKEEMEQEKVVVVSKESSASQEVNSVQQQQQQPRRCTHCLAQRTPQWRAGPLGPKTLCNACGVRYKSGRLLPEYRPDKSPTFVSYLHSNSHWKVMQMRMALLSSLPTEH